MAGLLQDSMTANSQADAGLGASADELATNYIQNLELKQAQKQGIGEAIGTAAGYEAKNLQAKKKPTPPQNVGAGLDTTNLPSVGGGIQNQSDTPSFAHPGGMMFGTLLKNLQGGVTGSVSTADPDSFGVDQ